jgi:hypothetical protein
LAREKERKRERKRERERGGGVRYNLIERGKRERSGLHFEENKRTVNKEKGREMNCKCKMLENKMGDAEREREREKE